MPIAGMDWFPAIWLGGGLFAVSALVAGYLTPGYSQFHQSISELGVRKAPYSWLVRWVGFISLGLSFVAFSHQTRDWFTTPVPSLLFLLIGHVILIAGIFPTDPDNKRDTISSKVHARMIIALIVLVSVVPFGLSIPALYRIPPPIWFFVFSILMGTLTLGFFLMLPFGKSRLITTLPQKTLVRFIRMWHSLQGLHQRILLSLYSIWWLVFSIALIR